MWNEEIIVFGCVFAGSSLGVIIFIIYARKVLTEETEKRMNMSRTSAYSKRIITGGEWEQSGTKNRNFYRVVRDPKIFPGPGQP